ncbi:MAG: septum formation protein Maf [Candidatus Marinimicrobia bacterium]|nr:septum formation protein Maf [Candidatus Neomarinimicrobiota bacterium]
MILASGSPRRRELLSRLGMPFEVVQSGIPEELRPDEDPEAACRRLAAHKADAISRLHPQDLVVGADTLVVLDDQVLGKPADLAEARRMLELLSDRTHLVLTAVSLVCQARRHRSGILATTAVTFHRLDAEDITYYLKVAPPLDKAGAYGIQDWSGVFVSSISGCYHNVMGFPLAQFYRHLKAGGLLGELQSRNNL